LIVLAPVAWLGYLHFNLPRRQCCVHQSPITVLVARTTIPKGTTGHVIRRAVLYSAETMRLTQVEDGAISAPSRFKGVTLRRIPRGEQLIAADFGRSLG
jgi:hypothetical protein